MDYVAGIDLGSTSLKAIIYDLAGNAVAGASRPTEKFHPALDHPEWTVWTGEQIWGGTAEAIREAVSKLDDPRHVKAVAVTGMGMDGIPIAPDGRWLYPFISWHDPRTGPQQQWWLDKIGAERTFAVTGFQVWVFNTALRLLWMKEHEPDILAKTDKWLVIEDFLNFMLCGRYATDYSMASCTLLFDQTRRTWSDEMCQKAGIDRRLLSDPQPSGTVLGEVTAAASKATGLAEGTKVVMGGHDFLCGALAGGAFKPGVVMDVVGTWEIAVGAVQKPVLTPEAQKMGVIVDSHVARDMYAVMGAVVAAEMLEWFRKEYGFEEKLKAEKDGGVDWDYLLAAARQSPPGSRGVMFLPHMSGSCLPVVDAKSMGAFVGLRGLATKGDMIRAVIEGLSYQYLQTLNALETSLNLQADRVIAIGGAVKNDLWMQCKADVLNRPIEAPELEEATPLGAAILAGIGVGLFADEQDAFDRTYKPGKVYTPDPSRAKLYAERFAVFQDLYPALKDIHGRVYDLK